MGPRALQSPNLEVEEVGEERHLKVLHLPEEALAEEVEQMPVVVDVAAEEELDVQPLHLSVGEVVAGKTAVVVEQVAGSSAVAVVEAAEAVEAGPAVV